MERTPHKLAVMVSGSGTLMMQMHEDGLPIDVVIADKRCPGLNFAEATRVPTKLLAKTAFGWRNDRKWNDQPDFDRVAYSVTLATYLNEREITVTAMAGFMTILDAAFFKVYRGIILNIHPSLLPSFKGENAVQDALDAGVKVTGTTIHVATVELDSGPIIAQQPVPVLPDDTKDVLHERIKKVERALYSQVLRDILLGTLELPSLN